MVDLILNANWQSNLMLELHIQKIDCLQVMPLRCTSSLNSLLEFWIFSNYECSKTRVQYVIEWFV
jgi:hypothetical protein